MFQENSRDKNRTYAYICFFTRRGTRCRTDMPFAMCSSHWRTLPRLDSTTENYTVLWLKIAMQYCIVSIGNQLQRKASTTQSLGHLAGHSKTKPFSHSHSSASRLNFYIFVILTSYASPRLTKSEILEKHCKYQSIAILVQVLIESKNDNPFVDGEMY